MKKLELDDYTGVQICAEDPTWMFTDHVLVTYSKMLDIVKQLHHKESEEAQSYIKNRIESATNNHNRYNEQEKKMEDGAFDYENDPIMVAIGNDPWSIPTEEEAYESFLGDKLYDMVNDS